MYAHLACELEQALRKRVCVALVGGVQAFLQNRIERGAFFSVEIVYRAVDGRKLYKSAQIYNRFGRVFVKFSSVEAKQRKKRFNRTGAQVIRNINALSGHDFHKAFSFKLANGVVHGGFAC
ncbi:unknown [Firmicutes bacterium CAG:475]|nr:unknown [Firmicutes bacterium CAG:475]